MRDSCSSKPFKTTVDLPTVKACGALLHSFTKHSVSIKPHCQKKSFFKKRLVKHQLQQNTHQQSVAFSLG